MRCDKLKRLLDIIGAFVAMIMFFPILVVISLAVKFSSPGPIFFRQERIGKHGRPFEMLKFRSMIDGAEKSGTGLYSYENDPRITKVGSFLRKSSLDELPQLFNVLGGAMSLVGPRPPVTYELGPWKEYTAHMKRRFDVKPGITGLAQVSGRNELDWDTKIEFDNQYVDLYEKKGALVDIKMLLLTVWVVIAGRNTVEANSNGDEGPVARKAKQAMEKH